jgi:hypothetical protein
MTQFSFILTIEGADVMTDVAQDALSTDFRRSADVRRRLRVSECARQR